MRQSYHSVYLNVVCGTKAMFHFCKQALCHKVISHFSRVKFLGSFIMAWEGKFTLQIFFRSNLRKEDMFQLSSICLKKSWICLKFDLWGKIIFQFNSAWFLCQKYLSVEINWVYWTNKIFQIFEHGLWSKNYIYIF